MNSTAGLLNHSVPTTHENDTDCHDNDQSVKTLFVVLHFTIIILGLPSNCFSVFMSYQHIRQGNELGVYLMNLALADICLILMSPIWIDYSFADEWRHGETACVVCAFLMFTQFYFSVALLCCIAVDRYLAVVHPLRYHFMRKVRTATCVCILLWIFTMVFNAATVSKVSVYNDENGLFCLYFFSMDSDHVKRVSYARFFIWFFVPSVLVGFCCWKIRKEVRSNRATEKEERERVCLLLGLVQLTLTICFGPFHIILLLRAWLRTCQTARWIYYPYKAAVALATVNCLADPLLYSFITRSGRARIKKAILALQRKSKSSKGSDLERELNPQFHRP
ncbi:hypothetical protein ACEWY4_005721 [Coilia grayii]|uniref:G-protein coupled receptors family 1 profile domain-containing protein n=1 Tax=Coilia grayii TaxID=363190 RepID=A0ABD1KJS8_9TELE